MFKKIITNSFEQTQQVGYDFAKTLKGGEVLALYGNLGAGKTTFMQGLAKGLGIKKNIISPTFIIMRTYQTDINDKKLEIRNLYHVDLYRIEGEDDVKGLGLLELMNQPENIVALEWPDKIENVLPEKRINIYFEYIRDDTREIRIA
jgi:tRNA threonylcarbamoyladenosine biosynthesis protein TsaE